MTKGEIRSVFAETYATLFSPVTVFIWALCIVSATLAGPFGSYETMDWPLRLAYWAAVVTMGIVIGYGARAISVLVIGFDRPLIFDLFAALLVGLSLGPLVWLTRSTLETVSGAFTTQLPGVMANTFLVAAGVYVLRRQFSRSEPGTYLADQSEGDPSHREEPRLLRRLSAENRGTILKLTARDHYVEVVTTSGTETLRMRLADAIIETEPTEGFCVHRSHWVNRTAITGVERPAAHKIFVVLTNGDRVPVSRKYRGDLDKAGILQADARRSARG